jgi:hypothetical protein
VNKSVMDQNTPESDLEALESWSSPNLAAAVDLDTCRLVSRRFRAAASTTSAGPRFCVGTHTESWGMGKIKPVPL